MTSIFTNCSNMLNSVTEGMYRVSNYKLGKPNLAKNKNLKKKNYS